MAQDKDYYAVLGVLPSIDDVALKAVYQALLKKYHPDVFSGSQQEAERITRGITEAYSVLSDLNKRAEYDRSRPQADTDPRTQAKSDESTAKSSDGSPDKPAGPKSSIATIIAGALIVGFLLVLIFLGSQKGAPIVSGASTSSTVSAEVQSKLDAAYEAYKQNNFNEAIRLYRPLADQGNAKAQTNLGVAYENGEGFIQDYTAAASWYRRAANQGNSDAQRALGRLYHFGHGVPQDDSVAARWILKAADQGNASAQNLLGTLYDNGVGVPQDYVQAHKWVNLAAAGSSDSEVRKEAATNRENIAARMTPAQIAEAQRLASEWKPN